MALALKLSNRASKKACVIFQKIDPLKKMRYVVTPVPLPAATVSDGSSLPQWLQRAAEALQLDEDAIGSLATSRGIIKQHDNVCPSESLDFCCAYSEQLRTLLGSNVSAVEGDVLSSWLISAPSGSVSFTASSVHSELILTLYASASLATAVACQDYTLAPQLFARAQACLREAMQYSDMLTSSGSPLPNGTASSGIAVYMTSELLGAFVSFIDAQMMELSSTNFISHNTTWMLSDASLQDNLRALLSASKSYGDAAPIFLVSGAECFTELAELSALKPHILTVAGRMAAAKCLFAERKYSMCIEECQEISSIIATCAPEEKGFVSISLCIECKDNLMEQLLELIAAAESSINASDSLSDLAAASNVPPGSTFEVPNVNAVGSAGGAAHEPLTLDLAPVQEPASEFLAGKSDNSAEVVLLNNIISQKDGELAEKQILIDSLNAEIEGLKSSPQGAEPASVLSSLDFTSLLLNKDMEIHRLQRIVMECYDTSGPPIFPPYQEPPALVDSVREQLGSTIAELRQELADLQTNFDDISKQLSEERLAAENANQIAAVLQGELAETKDELSSTQVELSAAKEELSGMGDLKAANADLINQIHILKEQAMAAVDGKIAPVCHGTAVLTDVDVINDAERKLQYLQDRVMCLERQLSTAPSAPAAAPSCPGPAVLTDVDVINDAERKIQCLQDRVMCLESQLLTTQKTLSDANETVAVYHQEIIEAEAEAERLRDSLLGADAARSTDPEAHVAAVPLTDDLIMGFANAAIDIGGLKAGVSQAKMYDDMVELIVALEVENEKLKKKCLEYEVSPPVMMSLEVEPRPSDDDNEPGLSASLLQSIGTEIAIQSAWTRLPTLTTHLQSIVDRALEQLAAVTTEYAQNPDGQRDGSSIVNEYSHSDKPDSFEPSDNPDEEDQNNLQSRLFSIGTSSDNIDILEKMLSENASEPLTLATVARKLKVLGEGLQNLPTVIISGYEEEKAYNTLAERIVELVTEQHETNMNSMADCYKDIEMAHISIADLRLCMRKSDKVTELYDRFSVNDQKRLYELQLIAQRKNAELVSLIRYMNLLVQAYQLSIEAIKQNTDSQACTGKINGVEISTVLLEKDEQIVRLNEALQAARAHGEQRASDLTQDVRLAKEECETLEKQLAEYKAISDGHIPVSADGDDYFHNLLADRDRQIKELTDIVSMLNAGERPVMPVEQLVTEPEPTNDLLAEKDRKIQELNDIIAAMNADKPAETVASVIELREQEVHNAPEQVVTVASNSDLIAEKDRQIHELNNIIAAMNANKPELREQEVQAIPDYPITAEPVTASEPAPASVYILAQEQYQDNSFDQEVHRLPDPDPTWEAEQAAYVTESAPAPEPEAQSVYYASTYEPEPAYVRDSAPMPAYESTPSIDYEQLLVVKNAEIKRLQTLCEATAVAQMTAPTPAPALEQLSVPAASSDNLVNPYASSAFGDENAAESVYARSSADIEEIQRLNTELNSSNSKVQELTESLELLRTKNIAANTAIDNQNNQIEELTQDKQKLQNLVIQLTEENLVKSATVQSVMTTSVASSTLATEINNLKLELSERDHEIIRLTHTIERLNKQIVDNAGNEVPQLSTVIEIPPTATNNEIIKNLVNSIKTQEASFTHIRTLLKEKQAEVLKLKEALERQEDIVRTLLSNPSANRMKASAAGAADGNDALVLTNYNDASAADAQAAEEERARLEERIQSLERELASKDYDLNSKSQELDTLRGDLRRLQDEAIELRSKINDLETQLRDARREIEQLQENNAQPSGDNRRSRMLDDYTQKDLNEQIKNLYEMLSAKDAEIANYKRRLGIEDDTAFTYL